MRVNVLTKMGSHAEFISASHLHGGYLVGGVLKQVQDDTLKKRPEEKLPGPDPIVLYLRISLFAAAGAVIMHFFLAEKLGAVKIIIHT